MTSWRVRQPDYQSVLTSFDRFTQGNQAADDMTLLILRRKTAADEPESNGNVNGCRTLLLNRWLAHGGRESAAAERAPRVAESLLKTLVRVARLLGSLFLGLWPFGFADVRTSVSLHLPR